MVLLEERIRVYQARERLLIEEVKCLLLAKGVRPLRLYGAGRISKRDWRADICGDSYGRVDAGYDNDACAPDPDDMPEWVEVNTIYDQVRYVGPFFFSCDHGCGHGNNEHGVARTSTRPRDGEYHDGDAWATRETVRRCLEAIEKADIVFAWLEPEAYGTAAELGYARALGKKIVVAHNGDPGDLWLASALASEVIVASNPIEALARLFPPPPPPLPPDLTEQLAEEVCESPVEKLMFRSFKRFGTWMKDQLGAVCRTDKLEIRSQFIVPSYRLDFAILPVKIAVEVDGHDFHERTKEQAARDKARDRALAAGDWTILRFTGSEVFRNADNCVDEIMRLASSRT